MADELRSEGFTVEVLNRQPGFDRACARKIAQLWKKYDVEIVQAHQYTPYFYAMAARGWCHARPPILFTEHGRFFPDLPNWKHKIFNRLWMSRYDRVVVVGRSVGDAIVQNEGIPARRVEVIYNGVSEAQFLENRLSAEQKSALRTSLGIGERPLILFVARLDTIKDHPTAMRAVRELLSRPSMATLPIEQRPILLLAGGGPEFDALQRYVHELGMESNIRLLGERKDISELLQVADVFMLTSVSEGIPLTLLEASATETPIVATQVGGIPEVVLPGETGLLAPAGDATGLADHLEHLLTDPAFAQTLRQNAKKRFTELFTERKMLAAYEEMLEEMRR